MNKDADPKKKVPSGIIGMVAAFVLFVAFGSIWKDTLGNRYGLAGGLIWGMVFLFAFTLGMLYFGRFVLPLSGSEGWTDGFQLLWRHYFRQANVYIYYLSQRSKNRNRKRRRRRKTAVIDTRPYPRSFDAIRAGILKSNKAVALYKGGSFVRAAGSGLVILYRKEYIAQVFDLRKHLRLQPFTAHTSDGIPVETNAVVLFQIKQIEEDLDDDLLYPYDENAIFQAGRIANIGADNERRGWKEFLSPQAAAILADKLSHFTLDELRQVDGANAGALASVRKDAHRQLARIADDNGLELLLINMSHIQPPEEILRQRIENWKASWESQIQAIYANSQAEAVRRSKNARARAQVEIIENIIESVNVMRQADDADLSQIITLRMIEALEETAASNSIQAMVPQQAMTHWVMDASRQMRDLLRLPEGGDA